MNRRSFIKSLAMAVAGVLSGAQLLGERKPRDKSSVGAQRERIDVMSLEEWGGIETGHTRRLYELTDDGYLEIWGQSSFPIYGATGSMSGVMARYRYVGDGSFREEKWATIDCMRLRTA